MSYIHIVISIVSLAISFIAILLSGLSYGGLGRGTCTCDNSNNNNSTFTGTTTVDIIVADTVDTTIITADTVRTTSITTPISGQVLEIGFGGDVTLSKTGQLTIAFGSFEVIEGITMSNQNSGINSINLPPSMLAEAFAIKAASDTVFAVDTLNSIVTFPSYAIQADIITELVALATPNNANAATNNVPVGGLYTSTANPAIVYIRTA